MHAFSWRRHISTSGGPCIPGGSLPSPAFGQSLAMPAIKRPSVSSGSTPKKLTSMKRKSGYYPKGSRKGTSDTRMSKKVEKGLREQVLMLEKRCADYEKRVKELEAEVEAERCRRLALEGEAADVEPRYRRALRDLRR